MPVVLVVADEALLRQDHVLVLRSMGYFAIEASGAEIALRYLEVFVVDVVITDLRVPGTDGLDLARRIRGLELARQPRVVLLCANPGAVAAPERAEIGIDAVLRKPVEKGALEEQVELGRLMRSAADHEDQRAGPGRRDPEE